jgi:replicative DNA helicase
MLKIVSPSAELAVLRGMTHKNRKIAGALLSAVDSSYFYSEESVEVFEAIKRRMHEEGESPTYRLLIEDPDLSEEARSHLRSSVATVQSTADAAKAARILNKYRQRRGMYNLAAHINSQMQGSRVDMDALLEEAATAFNIIRSKKSTTDAFLHFGRNNNSKDMVEHLLYGDRSEDVVPTGIKAFDTVSGGFARGSLVTIGANSGGGKSTLANAMGIKMATRGYKVLMVPLEMSKEEMTARTMANTTKTNLTKILLQRLATGERELVYKRQRRWERKVKEAGGRYTIFKPQEDMTIEEIMAAISAYDCDVVIVDYISLLKGVDGDDMWRALGAVARYAKINAEVEKRVNILLCQVGDDAKIRYARAISEHSSNSWIWVADKESKETGMTKIEQPKSRNSLAFPFTVKMLYEYMRVDDVALEDSGMGAIEEKKEDVKKKRRDVVNLATADI